MELTIDLDSSNSNASVRNHFGVDPGDATCKVIANFSHNKKSLKSIFILGMCIKIEDRFFHHLALMVSEAIEEKQMEEEGNMMIGAMRMKA
ncbi:MAG: hypothetical protein JKY50_22520 [Oleispira sp.]|nr:hypothetical protein [Oleispira sp.]